MICPNRCGSPPRPYLRPPLPCTRPAGPRSHPRSPRDGTDPCDRRGQHWCLDACGPQPADIYGWQTGYSPLQDRVWRLRCRRGCHCGRLRHRCRRRVVLGRHVRARRRLRLLLVGPCLVQLLERLRPEREGLPRCRVAGEGLGAGERAAALDPGHGALVPEAAGGSCGYGLKMMVLRRSESEWKMNRERQCKQQDPLAWMAHSGRSGQPESTA